MPDFSVILQTPEVRQIVQENFLERNFHDALFPKALFRASVSAELWNGAVGDTQLFTGKGLIKPKMAPLRPGVDPTPSSYSVEQWMSTLNQYADTIDTHMPTSALAVASLFLSNAQQLGMSAGQSLNRLVRNRMYNAGLSGHTVADGTSTTTALRVKSLNGFTRARRPDLVGGSPARFDPVSSANPLKIKLFDNGAETSNTVVGFTADTPGDETGPGILTLGTSATSVANRAYVIADDRTSLVRVGGGNKVDDVGASDLMLLATIRQMVARMRQMNVPEMPDGTYHMHCDPVTENQLFADAEFQRLYTGVPEGDAYKQFAIGRILGVTLFRNTECPQVDTVEGGLTATFSQDDNFAGELYNTGATTGVQVHRPIMLGDKGCFEYFQDLNSLITEGGLNGKVSNSAIVNNGIEVNTDRIQMIIRSPQNRLQDLVSTSWKFIGDWPVRTDAASGDGARYKRICVAEHGS